MTQAQSCAAVVIGGGPAGLMAAEAIQRAGVPVQLFDAMPSVGRKFLLAGRGGLNLTHSESADQFAARYGERRQQIESLLADFGADRLRHWSAELGIETFIGSSGRVFPVGMKAAPLLRAWLQRLRGGQLGPAVRFSMRHRWLGWSADGRLLRFETPQGEYAVRPGAVVLALGGGSWGRLGSNGAWVPLLAQRGVAVAPLLPANCGFDVMPRQGGPAEPLPLQVRAHEPGWSTLFASRYAGHALKTVVLRFTDTLGQRFDRRGEFVATATGVEGSLIYAVSGLLRNEILRRGHATLELDLLPDWSPEHVTRELTHPRGSRSLSSHIKSRLGLHGIKAALLYEVLGREALHDPQRLAAAIKALPLTVVAARPLDEAISSAGGVLFEALTPDLMCESLPGVFCAGEMLDWEAPTGGYLLTACLASGWRAGQGLVRFLASAAPG